MAEVIMAAELARVELLEEMKYKNNPPLTDKEEAELAHLKQKLDDIRRGANR